MPQSGGNTGFAGYEYQIEATVWLALELMLARSVTEKMVIEPPSQEDVEATVQDPADAALGLALEDSTSRLAFQIKSRSSAPWSASDFSKTIARGRTGGEATRVRKSPLEMLEADPGMRFVLITNETTSQQGCIARQWHLAGEHLVDAPAQHRPVALARPRSVVPD